jgi:hypothetical protein
MKNRRIGLVDIGLDEDFGVSMNFVQGVLQNINAGYRDDQGNTAPVVEVDFVRSRDHGTVVAALTAQYAVLHVMAHAGHGEGEPFLVGEGDVHISLFELAAHLQDKGQGLRVPAVLAEGCRTGSGVWKKAFRECIQDEVTYIGTRSNIGWYESTAVSSAFYSAFLRNRGKGVTGPGQAREAAERAARAYAEMTGKACPYSIETLSPSRRALKAFGRSHGRAAAVQGVGRSLRPDQVESAPDDRAADEP